VLICRLAVSSTTPCIRELRLEFERTLRLADASRLIPAYEQRRPNLRTVDCCSIDPEDPLGSLLASRRFAHLPSTCSYSPRTVIDRTPRRCRGRKPPRCLVGDQSSIRGRFTSVSRDACRDSMCSKRITDSAEMAKTRSSVSSTAWTLSPSPISREETVRIKVVFSDSVTDLPYRRAMNAQRCGKRR
jgi:hypothetical protein